MGHARAPAGRLAVSVVEVRGDGADDLPLHGRPELGRRLYRAASPAQPGTRATLLVGAHSQVATQ
jgi:hypothetical protein